MFDFFDKYGHLNCKIVLIEYVKCNSKDELNSKVNETISRYPNCVNYVEVESDEVKVKVERPKKNEKINDEVHLECGCGGRYTIFNIKQHSKTKKHILFLNPIQEEVEVEINL